MPQGRLRPHWRQFIDGLETMGEAERAKHWRLAERLLHENGLTYTADAGAGSAERPWDLDFVPVVLGAEDWHALEQGLIQRARLLNTILADLYGPQKLLRDGHLPAAVVLGNPHFLRPVHGIRPRDGLYLQLYAADLGRGPDGRWWVLGRSHPGAVRRRLRPGEPHRAVALPARAVPRLPRPPAGQLLPGHARQPGRPDQPRESADRAADAGAGGGRLLRPRLSGALPGIHAGRRRRPDRPRQPRLPEVGRRPEAGRPDPPPRRRRRVRSAGTAGGLDAGRVGAAAGGARRHRHRRQRARQRPGRDQGDAGVPARPVPPAAGRGPEDPQHLDVVVRRRAGPQLRSRQPRRARHRLARSSGGRCCRGRPAPCTALR